MEALESGEMEASVLFGLDIGWQAYHAGFCYLSLGKLEKARSYLEEVIREHSDEKYPWCRQRRKAAERGLESLS